MKEFLLILGVIAAMVAGYPLMKRIDRFIDRNAAHRDEEARPEESGDGSDRIE